MSTNVVFIALGLPTLLCAASAQPVPVVTAANTSTAPPSEIEQTIKEIKNPISWFSWGADFRFRNEYFDDLLTLTPNNPLHEQDYFRVRARLWASITPVDDLNVNVRIATEPREWMKPAGYTPYKGRSGLDPAEGIIDNLNVQWKNVFGQPASLIVGRQDITLGEGWLTGDGTPFDGSWTYYLDAARFSYELKEQHTLVEALGILQDAKDEGWLPTINNQNRFETEQNEKGAILNVVNTTLPWAGFNPYFIYKTDQRASTLGSTVPAPRGGDDGNIYTVGGRLFGVAGMHWKYSVEGAYQFGEKQDRDITDASTALSASTRADYRDINAFGMNSKLGYCFKDRFNNQLAFSYEFLSGDDPKTHNDEMFDVLWGRYPRWSEIGLYLFAPETRIGQEANMHRFGPTWTVTPLSDLDFCAGYYAWFASENVPTRAAGGLFTGNGNFRGHFTQAVLKYKFSRHVTGHLRSEFLFPGDYYVSRATAYFLRAEVMLMF